MHGMQGVSVIAGVRLTKVAPMVIVHPLKIIGKECLLNRRRTGE